MAKERFSEVKEQFLKLLKSKATAPQIAEKLGINLRTVTKWKAKLAQGTNAVESDDIPESWVAESRPTQRRFIITSVLNDSLVCRPFLDALGVYSKEFDAQLLVVPILYRNPDMYHKGGKPETTWPELPGHYLTSNLDLGPNLRIIADFNVNATAKHPLSGLNGVAGGRSVIIGHPKQDLEYNPAGYLDLPRMYTGTGTLSLPEYSESKVGGLAEQDHVLGALIVDLEESGHFHARHIVWDGEKFLDLTGCYTPEARLPKGDLIAAVVLGDVHVPFQDPVAWPAAIKFCGTYNPRYVVCHDFFDGYSISYHDTKQAAVPRFKAALGLRNLDSELLQVYEQLQAISCEGRELVMPISNHHDHLDRWLLDRGNKDDLNFLTWIRIIGEYARYVSVGPSGELSLPNALEVAVGQFEQQNGSLNLTWLSQGQSLFIGGTDVSSHGHAAPGGARGSIRGFAKSVTPMMIGHSHKPGKSGKVTQVGTLSRLDRGYKLDAYNTWVHGVGVIYDNGAHALINFIDGKWSV